MTGHPEQPRLGQPGFPRGADEDTAPGGGAAGSVKPAGSRPPGDQHHEDVPRGGLSLGFGGAAAAWAPYGRSGPASDQLWSAIAYAGMIVFLFIPPLSVYLAKRRESPFVRYHAAQALNLWITGFLYTLSCLILAGLLTLDTAATALAVLIVLLCAVWVPVLASAVLSGVTASRGRQRTLPRWICSPLVK